ncbi:B12-binding domain-containing radical SAM protein [Saccharothrix australiensis]|uniref:B12-binding domain-containing radical SAM protein n=1 Tax=Saccharothrix australiensis TaxID=2072 RepID=UPI0014773F02|nr:radical SAM protein [Saccharothrix australiensis]
MGRHVPIGLAYLSATLRAAGHETVVFDALAHVEDNHVVPDDELTGVERLKLATHPRWRHVVHWGARWERIAEAVAASRADVVGISCMFTPFYESAYDLARLTRSLLPEAAILLGGQHGTVFFHHTLQVPEIDAVVLGEAESTVVPLVAAIEEGRPFDGLAGVAFRCGAGRCACGTPGPPHVRPRAPFVPDLDALPMPAVDQLDFARYDHTTTLITSRGCPFSCTFCTVHATVGREFRARSPKHVVDEIEHCVERLGVRRFLIEDDNFTFDVDRVHAICDEILARGLDVRLRLPNGITVVKLTEDLVGKMVSAGFESLFFGLETTDVKRLRKMRKGFTSLPKVAEGASLFEKYGLSVNGSLIAGLPGQTLTEIVQDSVNCAVREVRFYTNPFYPIPGSPDYRTCLAEGLIDPLTEPALFDQFNFAFGNGELTSEQLYWTWIGTQAMALWPRYAVEGSTRRADGPVTPAEAARRLVEHSAALKASGQRLDVCAVVQDYRVVEGGLLVRTARENCFCAIQRVADDVRRTGTTDLCLFSGDVIAAAIAGYTGVPHAAEQVASDVGQGCSFLLRPTEAEPVAPIQREFVARLDATRREVVEEEVAVG